MINLKLGFVLLCALLVGACNSSDDITSGGISGTGIGVALEGLESCIQPTDSQSLLCGSVTAADGVTPVSGVEVKLDSATTTKFSLSGFSSRGIADESKCLTDSQGEYACVLPSDISGITTFILVEPGFAIVSFEVDVQVDGITTVQPQILNPESAISVVDDPTTISYVTSSCDSLPVQSMVSSTDQNNPTPLLAGTVADAKLDRPNNENDTHYWMFDVSAGTYHLVIDAITESLILPVGLNVSVLRSAEPDLDSVINDNAVAQPRIRHHVPINVENDTSLVIRVEAKFQATPYQLGLFEDGRAVPTPYFTDCIDVVSMSLDTTESFSFNRAEERWYSLSMDSGTYDIKVNAVRSGPLLATQYRLDALSNFAQTSSEIELGRVNTIEQSHTLRSVLTVEQGRLVYFRLINPWSGFYIETMEMTINKR